jgi:macrodomain Ter protein organizer (MatP/YcbG family)
VATTEPINGNDFEAIADNLIMETPNNSDGAPEETVEATVDEQPEVVEPEAEDQDVVEASTDDLEFDDDEDVEVEINEVSPELYRVKVDGVESEVTLDELKRGYSGQKYIQKGMSEVAQTRKQIDEAQQAISQERQVLLQMMQQMQQEGIPQIPEYPSAELQNSDPVGFNIQAENYRRAVEQRREWEERARYVAAQDERAKVEAENAYLAQQAMRVAEWMPDFADPEKQAAIIQDIKSKSQRHYGLTDEQLNTVKTADELRILQDALKYRELVANKSKAQQKAEGAPPVKPAAKRAASAGKSSKARQATQKMRKSGTHDDVTNWLLS